MSIEEKLRLSAAEFVRSVEVPTLRAKTALRFAPVTTSAII